MLWLVIYSVVRVVGFARVDLREYEERGSGVASFVWTVIAVLVLAALLFVPAHARPVFVRKADGRTVLMVEKAVAGTPVTLTYTIPQWQRATVGCDAPAMNPIAAHVDSVRLLAWLPMPDDSRVWNLAAWVAAQQAGRGNPVVVRTKWIGGRTGVDTIAVPAGYPVGTTGAVVSFAGGQASCVSNLTRLVNP